MPTIIKEGRRTAEFLASEANGYRSREQVTLLAGQTLKAGSVLGQVTVAAAVAAAVAGNTGDGAIGAVAVGAGARAGVYQLVCIEPAANAGKFNVEDPDGVIVGVATVAVAFNAGGLGFTIADGAADFVAGDRFTITVAPGSGKYKAWNPANADGSQLAAGVLYDNVDASAGDARAVAILRDAEVNGSVLEWFAGASANQKAAGAAQLAAAGIIVRP